MPVKIRLAKIGKKHAPTYRVVVTKTRSKRNSKFLETLGSFSPVDTSTEFTYDKKSYANWVAQGAQVSDAVKQLIEGNYVYTKYDPKAAKEQKDTAALEQKVVAETPKEAVAETPEEEKVEEVAQE